MDHFILRRLCALTVLCAALSACAHLDPVQQTGQTRIVVGSTNVQMPDADIAPRYALYAVMAAKAYEDIEPDGTFRKTQEASFILRPHDGEADERVSLDRQARDAIAREGWRRVAAYVGPLACRKEEPDCRGQKGLVIHVWRQAGICREMVIAIRGTDDFHDWIANLRWVTRHFSGYDQYEQVQAHIRQIVQKELGAPCYRGRKTRITAVGHSLGGGLAQQAAYVDTRINRVFAFDPSPVTGYYDVHVTAQSKDLADLDVDRIYEHGEALAYFRFVMRHLYPPSVCDPQVRLVRFNALRGTIVSQHSMGSLAAHFLQLTGNRRPYSVLNPAPVPLPSAQLSERSACTYPDPATRPTDLPPAQEPAQEQAPVVASAI